MTTPHPFAHILHPIADGVTNFQIIPLLGDGNWADRTVEQMLEIIQHGNVKPSHMRVKPRTITINGREVPEPLREAPAHEALYWMPALSDEDVVRRVVWHGDNFDRRALQNGQVHLTRQAAHEHAEALLSFTLVRGA